MNDALGYIRVSSEEQAGSGLGLEAQRQCIAAYSAVKGLHLAEVFEDPGISGGKPLASRPAGSRLLAAAKKTKAIVVAAKLDRLFRSVADAASVIADFDKRGIRLVAIAESFDTTNPYGRAMAQMASVFAELERAMIRERTQRPERETVAGRAHQRPRAVWLGLRLGRASGGECPGTESDRAGATTPREGHVLARDRHAAGQ